MNEEQIYVNRYDPETGALLHPEAAQPTAPEAPAADPNAAPIAAPIAAQAAAQTSPKRQRHASNRQDLVLAVLLAAALALFSDTMCYAGSGLGMSLSLLLALCAELWYLWRSDARRSRYAVFLACGAMALVLSPIFSDDALFRFYCTVGSICLMTLLPVELWQQRRRPAGSFSAASDFFSMLFVRSFGRLGDGVWALTHAEGAEDQARGRKLGAVLIGLVMAIPVLAIVIPLLMGSDAAFEGLIRGIELGELPGHLAAVIFGLCLALLVFSQLFSVRRSSPMEPAQQMKPGTVDPIVVVSFLVILSLTYVLYLISQGAYFFDGFLGLLPEGYSVAEYARRGFFEMSLVCLLNFGLLLLAIRLTRKPDGSTVQGVRLFGLFICLFSLTLIVISFSKMFLYIDCFGLTRLRITTSAFMLLLACVFAALALRLFVPATPYMKTAVIAATLIAAALTLGGVDRIVASYNVRAYEQGALDSVDMYTLETLDCGTVPSLIRLLDEPRYADQARVALRDWTKRLFVVVVHNNDGNRSVELFAREYTDWRSFNTAELQAKQLIQENLNRIYP